MADLNGSTIASTYGSLLKFDDNGIVEEDDVQLISDGRGNDTSLYLSELRASIKLGNTSDDDFIVWSQSASNALVIEGDSGNVGINTSTPGSTLPDDANSTTPRILEIQSVGTSTDVGIMFSRSDGYAVGGDMWYDISEGVLNIDNRYNHADGDIRFRTKTAGTEVDVMTLEASGKVGIGTTAPSSSWNSNANLLHISQNDVNGSIVQLMSSNTTLVIHAGNNQAQIGTTSTEPLRFYTNGSSNERMTILGDGNVGIGNNNPTGGKLVIGSYANPVEGTSSNATEANSALLIAPIPAQIHAEDSGVKNVIAMPDSASGFFLVVTYDSLSVDDPACTQLYAFEVGASNVCVAEICGETDSASKYNHAYSYDGTNFEVNTNITPSDGNHTVLFTFFYHYNGMVVES
jgi:hypothetical protein